MSISSKMLEDFSIALEKEYKEQVEKTVMRFMDIATTLVFDSILENSRVFSGYYLANHRIGIGGLDIAELDPPERGDPSPFQYLDLAATSRDFELRKLEDIKTPWIKIILGTAVPYAPILEGEDATYTRGVEEGLLQTAGFFAVERF